MASREDRLKISLESMMRTVGSETVECVFDVTYRLDIGRKRRQHVILLKDSSYICTCLLLQNNGIVCRHFFHLMQVDRRFKYHIKLIPRRWYMDHLQDSEELEESFGLFLRAMTQQANIGEGGDGTPDVPDVPAVTFMSDIFKIFPSAPSLSQDDQSHLSKKRRHGEISGLVKDIFNVVESSPEMFEIVKEGLSDVIVKGRGLDGMKDPVHVKAKGRPRKSRMKSSMETTTRSTKCGVCNKLGHNSRKHYGQNVL
jgi:hypothetical protein